MSEKGINNMKPNIDKSRNRRRSLLFRAVEVAIKANPITADGTIAASRQQN